LKNWLIAILIVFSAPLLAKDWIGNEDLKLGTLTQFMHKGSVQDWFFVPLFIHDKEKIKPQTYYEYFNGKTAEPIKIGKLWGEHPWTMYHLGSDQKPSPAAEKWSQQKRTIFLVGDKNITDPDQWIRTKPPAAVLKVVETAFLKRYPHQLECKTLDSESMHYVPTKKPLTPKNFSFSPRSFKSNKNEFLISIQGKFQKCDWWNQTLWLTESPHWYWVNSAMEAKLIECSRKFAGDNIYPCHPMEAGDFLKTGRSQWIFIGNCIEHSGGDMLLFSHDFKILGNNNPPGEKICQEAP
jgi:hypothetical protein